MATTKQTSLRRSPKKHLSIRIGLPLDEFLREKGSEHPGGFSGFVEELIEFGAIAHGYQPAADNTAYRAFADTIATVVLERMEEKGMLPKPGANE